MFASTSFLEKPALDIDYIPIFMPPFLHQSAPTDSGAATGTGSFFDAFRFRSVPNIFF